MLILGQVNIILYNQSIKKHILSVSKKNVMICKKRISDLENIVQNSRIKLKKSGKFLI